MGEIYIVYHVCQTAARAMELPKLATGTQRRGDLLLWVYENPREKHYFELAFTAPLCNLLAVHPTSDAGP